MQEDLHDSGDQKESNFQLKSIDNDDPKERAACRSHPTDSHQPCTAWMDSVIAPMFPDGRPNGSVFIGTSSEEMTGTTYHIHADFKPTIERVKIDFEDKTLGHWNKELLSLAGSLSRCAYEHEVDAIASKENESIKTAAGASKVKGIADRFGEKAAGSVAAAASIALMEPIPQHQLFALTGVVNVVPTTRATKVNEFLVHHGFLRDTTPFYIATVVPSDEEDRGAIGLRDGCALTGVDSASAQYNHRFDLTSTCYMPFDGMEAFLRVPTINPLFLHRYEELWRILVRRQALQVMDSRLIDRWVGYNRLHSHVHDIKIAAMVQAELSFILLISSSDVINWRLLLPLDCLW